MEDEWSVAATVLTVPPDVCFESSLHSLAKSQAAVPKKTAVYVESDEEFDSGGEDDRDALDDAQERRDNAQAYVDGFADQGRGELSFH